MLDQEPLHEFADLAVIVDNENVRLRIHALQSKASRRQPKAVERLCQAGCLTQFVTKHRKSGNKQTHAGAAMGTVEQTIQFEHEDLKMKKATKIAAVSMVVVAAGLICDGRERRLGRSMAFAIVPVPTGHVTRWANTRDPAAVFPTAIST